MDESEECYFRFTVILLIGGGVLFVLFIACLCKCLNVLSQSDNNRSKSNTVETRNGHMESVLGEEFKSNPTIISDVSGIGKSHDNEHEDLSLVEESRHHKFDLDDSFRDEEIIPQHQQQQQKKKKHPY